jgi:hypothetical protein
MPQGHPQIELTAIDLSGDWTRAGLPPGIERKILTDDLDEAAKTGARRQLIRFAPGTVTATPAVHDFWEDAFLLHGDLMDGRAAGKPEVSAPAYACRAPGTPHGPFSSRQGCVILELQYYRK